MFACLVEFVLGLISLWRLYKIEKYSEKRVIPCEFFIEVLLSSGKDANTSKMFWKEGNPLQNFYWILAFIGKRYKYSKMFSKEGNPSQNFHLSLVYTPKNSCPLLSEYKLYAVVIIYGYK